MNLKHGRSADPIYIVWRGMNDRCKNPNLKSWPHYGGRGIQVCARWRDSFEAFVEDMGERPVGATLERLDNDKGYEPGNVIWASREAQDANKRSNRLLLYNGEDLPLFVIAKRAGLPRDRLAARLRLGYSIAEATSPDFDSCAKNRGISKARAAARTHCCRGHELTEENTFLYGKARPLKCCKQCRRETRLRRLGRFAEPAKPGCVCVTVSA